VQARRSVNAVAFDRVGFDSNETVDRAGWNANAGIGPTREVGLNLGGVTGHTPVTAVALL
jgi:hypothetical protein